MTFDPDKEKAINRTAAARWLERELTAGTPPETAHAMVAEYVQRENAKVDAIARAISTGRLVGLQLAAAVL